VQVGWAETTALWNPRRKILRKEGAKIRIRIVTSFQKKLASPTVFRKPELSHFQKMRTYVHIAVRSEVSYQQGNSVGLLVKGHHQQL
jgi:hypothetical protein